jgi:hypothetical protein
VDSRDGTVFRCCPATATCTVVVSIHNVTCCPARCGPSQNCCPATCRLPDVGTTRSTSTASGHCTPPLPGTITLPAMAGGGGVVSGGAEDAGSGAGARSAGSHSGGSPGGAGRNRSPGLAISSDWCGRVVLYSTRHASTAACASSSDANGGCSSRNSVWML